MAKYASLSDIKERIAVIEEDLVYADRVIDNTLRAKGIPVPQNPPYPEFLNTLAVLIGLYRACIRLAQAEDTTLMEKAKFYQQEIDRHMQMLSPSVLGMTVSTSINTAKMQRA